MLSVPVITSESSPASQPNLPLENKERAITHGLEGRVSPIEQGTDNQDITEKTTSKIEQIIDSKTVKINALTSSEQSLEGKMSPLIVGSPPSEDTILPSIDGTAKKVAEQAENKFPGQAVAGAKSGQNMLGFWSTVAVPAKPAELGKINAEGIALGAEDISVGVIDFIKSVTHLAEAVKASNGQEALRSVAEILLALALIIGGSLFFAFRVLEGLSADFAGKVSHVLDSTAQAMAVPGLYLFEIFFSVLALLSIDKLIGHFRFTQILDKDGKDGEDDWFESIQKEIDASQDSEKRGWLDRLLNISIEARIGKETVEGIKNGKITKSDKLLKSLKAENTKNKVIAVARVAIAVVGIVTIALHFVACPPAAIIAITTILCAGSIALSLYQMQAAWAKEAYNAYDKKWNIAYAVVTILNLAFTVLLSHFAIHVDLKSLIAPCVAGGIMLALYGLNYYKLHQREKAWKEEPELSALGDGSNGSDVKGEEVPPVDDSAVQTENAPEVQIDEPLKEEAV